MSKFISTVSFTNRHILLTTSYKNREPSGLSVDPNDDELDSTNIPVRPIHDYLFHYYMDKRIENYWIPLIQQMDIANGKTVKYYENPSVIKIE